MNSVFSFCLSACACLRLPLADRQVQAGLLVFCRGSIHRTRYSNNQQLNAWRVSSEARQTAINYLKEVYALY